RVKLDVTSIGTWYRMPRPSSDYGFADGLSFDEHRAYIAEAIGVSDADIDYSRYDIVYVVASSGSDIPISPAFHAYPGSGILADGTEVRHAATFGADIRVPRKNYGSNV